MIAVVEFSRQLGLGKRVRQLVLLALLLIGMRAVALAVDPIPVEPQDPLIDHAASEGSNKRIITESNDYFYIDDEPTFRVTFAPSSYKKRIITLNVALVAFAYEETGLHIRPKITVHDPAFPNDPSQLLTVNFKPGTELIQYCKKPTGQCQVSGMWWLDPESDPATLALLHNTPVNVDVEVDTDGEGADGSISIVAEVKKK